MCEGVDGKMSEGMMGRCVRGVGREMCERVDGEMCEGMDGRCVRGWVGVH